MFSPQHAPAAQRRAADAGHAQPPAPPQAQDPATGAPGMLGSTATNPPASRAAHAVDWAARREAVHGLVQPPSATQAAAGVGPRVSRKSSGGGGSKRRAAELAADDVHAAESGDASRVRRLQVAIGEHAPGVHSSTRVALARRSSTASSSGTGGGGGAGGGGVGASRRARDGVVDETDTSGDESSGGGGGGGADGGDEGFVEASTRPGDSSTGASTRPLLPPLAAALSLPTDLTDVRARTLQRPLHDAALELSASGAGSRRGSFATVSGEPPPHLTWLPPGVAVTSTTYGQMGDAVAAAALGEHGHVVAFGPPDVTGGTGRGVAGDLASFDAALQSLNRGRAPVRLIRRPVRVRRVQPSDLFANFHMSLGGVARMFGVSLTTLKVTSRVYGVTRWPYRLFVATVRRLQCRELLPASFSSTSELKPIEMERVDSRTRAMLAELFQFRFMTNALVNVPHTTIDWLLALFDVGALQQEVDASAAGVTSARAPSTRSRPPRGGFDSQDARALAEAGMRGATGSDDVHGDGDGEDDVDDDEDNDDDDDDGDGDGDGGAKVGRVGAGANDDNDTDEDMDAGDDAGRRHSAGGASRVNAPRRARRATIAEHARGTPRPERRADEAAVRAYAAAHGSFVQPESVGASGTLFEQALPQTSDRTFAQSAVAASPELRAAGRGGAVAPAASAAPAVARRTRSSAQLSASSASNAASSTAIASAPSLMSSPPSVSGAFGAALLPPGTYGSAAPLFHGAGATQVLGQQPMSPPGSYPGARGDDGRHTQLAPAVSTVAQLPQQMPAVGWPQSQSSDAHADAAGGSGAAPRDLAAPRHNAAASSSNSSRGSIVMSHSDAVALGAQLQQHPLQPQHHAVPRAGLQMGDSVRAQPSSDAFGARGGAQTPLYASAAYGVPPQSAGATTAYPQSQRASVVGFGVAGPGAALPAGWLPGSPSRRPSVVSYDMGERSGDVFPWNLPPTFASGPVGGVASQQQGGVNRTVLHAGELPTLAHAAASDASAHAQPMPQMYAPYGGVAMLLPSASGGSILYASGAGAAGAGVGAGGAAGVGLSASGSRRYSVASFGGAQAAPPYGLPGAWQSGAEGMRRQSLPSVPDLMASAPQSLHLAVAGAGVGVGVGGSGGATAASPAGLRLQPVVHQQQPLAPPHGDSLPEWCADAGAEQQRELSHAYRGRIAEDQRNVRQSPSPQPLASSDTSASSTASATVMA